MPAADFTRLAPHLQPVDFGLGEILIAAGAKATHAHFIESGLGSVVALTREGHRIEVNVFGVEGLSAPGVPFGIDRSPLEHLIQVAGRGLRIPVAPLQAAVRDSAALTVLFHGYAQSCGVQAAYTALTNAAYGIDRRLARWLLMCADRLGGQRMALTHEFLSVMLGVRRAGVTVALHKLVELELVSTARGTVSIRDRTGLERFAGDAYGVPEEEYRRLVGVPVRT
jgi:CRP-like cAMP-binding protein